MKRTKCILILLAAGLFAQTLLSQTLGNTITFKNQSGDPVLLKLIGPTQTALKIPDNLEKTIAVEEGTYYILTRFGMEPGPYQYSRGKNFVIENEVGYYSAMTLILQERVDGNYGTIPVSDDEFENPEPAADSSASRIGSVHFPVPKLPEIPVYEPLVMPDFKPLPVIEPVRIDTSLLTPIKIPEIPVYEPLVMPDFKPLPVIEPVRIDTSLLTPIKIPEIPVYEPLVMPDFKPLPVIEPVRIDTSLLTPIKIPEIPPLPVIEPIKIDSALFSPIHIPDIPPLPEINPVLPQLNPVQIPSDSLRLPEIKPLPQFKPMNTLPSDSRTKNEAFKKESITADSSRLKGAPSI